MTQSKEMDLVFKYRYAKELLESKQLQLDEAKKSVENIETELIDLLQAEGKERTAKYEGVGFISLMSPKVYASCLKEKEEELFSYLRSEGREDMIRPTVNARTLSSYTKELMEEGKNVPECISYYMKPSIRLYA